MFPAFPKRNRRNRGRPGAPREPGDEHALHLWFPIISGVPAYLINTLEGITARLKIKNLRKIWPNLEVFCYAGTAIENYRGRLDELAGLPLKYIGIYIATEAPLGLTRTTSSDFSFNTGSILYSFNRFDDQDGKTLGIDEQIIRILRNIDTYRCHCRCVNNRCTRKIQWKNEYEAVDDQNDSNSCFLSVICPFGVPLWFLRSSLGDTFGYT